MSDTRVTNLAHETGTVARFGTGPTADADSPVAVAARVVPRTTERRGDEVDQERADDDGMGPTPASMATAVMRDLP